MKQDAAKKIENIAEICHEANRVWCKQNGDDSHLDWLSAPQWQKDSSMNGVMFVMAEPDAADSAQHDAWMADKIKNGWTYGPIKDGDAKTHPCIVPFDALPEFQKVKDRLFRAIVKACL